MRRIEIPIGSVFNKLTVLSFIGNGRDNYGVSIGAMWLCRCACGKFAEINSSKLRTNQKKTCGCRMVDRKTPVSKPCLILGCCDEGRKVRGYCAKHYYHVLAGNIKAGETSVKLRKAGRPRKVPILVSIDSFSHHQSPCAPPL